MVCYGHGGTKRSAAQDASAAIVMTLRQIIRPLGMVSGAAQLAALPSRRTGLIGYRLIQLDNGAEEGRRRPGTGMGIQSVGCWRGSVRLSRSVVGQLRAGGGFKPCA